MANPSLLQQFCSTGQKDAISSVLQTAGWSPENPYINGYQMNTLFNEIFTYLNYLKNKGLSFWEDTKPYKATAGDIDIVRYANKIYFAKLDSNLDGLTPKTPDTNPTYWGVLYDLDKPLKTTYALLGGLATQTFKVADAVNADEAVNQGQLIQNPPLQGSNADLVRGLPADFTSSKVNSGYQKLPSGLIIQWIRFTSTINSDETFNFPLAFPTSVFAMATGGEIGIGSTYDNEANFSAIVISNSQFIVNRTDNISGNMTYTCIAIGH